MKDLTFGEAAAILKEIEAENPKAERVEIIAVAYRRGYAAAEREQGRA